jgi:hypothetical protein
MSVIIAATLTGIMVATASEIQTFIDALNSKWGARDYNGIKQVIQDRLAQKTNDLPALIARADYYSSIESNPAVVQATASQIKQIRDSLVWTNDPDAKLILDAMMHFVDNAQDAASAGYISSLTSNQLEQAHSESPTTYPVTSILPRYYAIQNP